MNRLEKFFYELRPFNLLIIAAFALKSADHVSQLGQASVALLALSSLLIFYWRYQYRSSVQLRRR